jgi:TonB family protein
VPRRAELITAGIAVIIHIGLGVTVSRAGKSPARPRPPKQVVLEFAKRPEPKPAPELAPAPAATPATPHAPVARKVAVRAPRPVAHTAAPAARASAPPAATPSASPPPMYAVAMASTTEVAQAVGVPGGKVGGTGTGRPGAALSPTGGNGSGDGFKAISARDVGSLPEVDTDACGRAAVYPREAEQSGIEGDVRLRVALNEQGKVHAVRVLSGLGAGLDAAAVDAIKNRCRFKPARGRDGQPVAFVIESYKFHFELPR